MIVVPTNEKWGVGDDCARKRYKCNDYTGNICISSLSDHCILALSIAIFKKKKFFVHKHTILCQLHQVQKMQFCHSVLILKGILHIIIFSICIKHFILQSRDLELNMTEVLCLTVVYCFLIWCASISDITHTDVQSL